LVLNDTESAFAADKYISEKILETVSNERS